MEGGREEGKGGMEGNKGEEGKGTSPGVWGFLCLSVFRKQLKHFLFSSY